MERYIQEVISRSSVSFTHDEITEPSRSEHRDHIGISPHRLRHLVNVGLLVLVGSIHASPWLELAALATRYLVSDFRLTAAQNVVLSAIPRDRLKDILNEPILSVLSPSPPRFLRGTVSCTGKQFCDKAIIETKQLAAQTAAELDAIEKIGPAWHIHWSGCPNSCGQHQVADIGLQGTKTKVDGITVDAVDIHLGRRVAPNDTPGLVIPRVPVSKLGDILRDLIMTKEEQPG